jgi:hypothetical protein
MIKARLNLRISTKSIFESHGRSCSLQRAENQQGSQKAAFSAILKILSS